MVMFLCSMSLSEVRGDCTFRCYWCNCWSSLFKLSFHNDI